MKVLKAIGRFFAKIWNWIKETAWIQPLLIVGLIFGVIFAIPPITKGIEELQENGPKYGFIDKHTVSAKDLLAYENNGTLVNELADDNANKTFLLVLVEKDNDASVEAEKGFRYMFSSNGKKTYFSTESQKEASVKFLYQWEKSDADNKDLKKKFRKDVPYYLEWEEKHQDAIELAYKNTCEKYGFEVGDFTSTFMESKLPVISMIRYENGAITDVIFKVEGTTKTEKADYIRDFYFHQGSFEKK